MQCSSENTVHALCISLLDYHTMIVSLVYYPSVLRVHSNAPLHHTRKYTSAVLHRPVPVYIKLGEFNIDTHIFHDCHIHEFEE